MHLKEEIRQMIETLLASLVVGVLITSTAIHLVGPNQDSITAIIAVVAWGVPSVMGIWLPGRRGKISAVISGVTLGAIWTIGGIQVMIRAGPILAIGVAIAGPILVPVLSVLFFSRSFSKTG